MFKARAPPKNRRKNDGGDGVVDLAEEDDLDVTKGKLREVRELQHEHWWKPKGVDANAQVKQRAEEKEDEEEEDHWGLDTGFAGSTVQKGGPDKHMEDFINERLNLKKQEEVKAKEKTREEKLFEIPESLQVEDAQAEAKEKMSWMAGLAEVPLGVEYKIANIEATEKAKREFLYGEGAGASKGAAAVMEPDAVTRKAFGSRFMHFADRSAGSKSATDDAVLERFRKRMRR